MTPLPAQVAHELAHAAAVARGTSGPPAQRHVGEVVALEVGVLHRPVEARRPRCRAP